jgi:hypothetical protein
MTLLIIAEYKCHKLAWVYSACRNPKAVLASLHAANVNFIVFDLTRFGLKLTINGTIDELEPSHHRCG